MANMLIVRKGPKGYIHTQKQRNAASANLPRSSTNLRRGTCFEHPEQGSDSRHSRTKSATRLGTVADVHCSRGMACAAEDLLVAPNAPLANLHETTTRLQQGQRTADVVVMTWQPRQPHAIPIHS